MRKTPCFEREELAQLYVARGVEAGLAREVATQLMAKDALGAHARDELGISEISTARPVQAALASAATFSVGAAAPLLLVLGSPSNVLIPAVAIGSLLFSLPARRGRRESRRGRPAKANHTRDLLGCLRHGADGRDWRRFRQSGLGSAVGFLRSLFTNSARGRS